MAGVSELNQVVEDCMDLPPGFRFHPTDEEIVTHYLSHKVVNRSFNPRAMGEVDLNRCEPWDLPGKAKMGVKEWYFFCHKDKKYPTGMRTNRATKAGYWKATGKDKEIYRGRGQLLVGMKKTLVFYEGRAPKGTKTNWVMHEFRLEGKSNLTNVSKSVKDEWVVCRVFHKNISPKKTPQQPGMKRVDSLGEEFFHPDETLPPLMDPPYAGPSSRPGTSLAAGGGHVDNGLLYPSFSSLMGTETQQQFMSSNPAAPNVGALYYPQLQQQSSYHSPPGSLNMGYLHQNQDILRVLTGAAVNNDASSSIRKHCKAEQCSNQSIGCPSQDTGLSTDHNTEISSVVSKHYVVDDYLDFESIFWSN